MAGNALLYIKKELNVKTRIFPRSSFRSVPFVKKGIVTVSFSSFESFLNACYRHNGQMCVLRLSHNHCSEIFALNCETVLKFDWSAVILVSLITIVKNFGAYQSIIQTKFQ